MRSLLAFLLLASTHCAPSQYNPVRYGEYAVAIEDCGSPQTEWIVAELRTLGALGPGFRQALAGELIAVSVRCADTGDMGGAGEYTLGASEVLVDLTKAPGEFAVRQAAGHELVHWYLHTYSPHPEYGQYHVCEWAYNEPTPPGCYPLARASNVLMSPSLTAGMGGLSWTTEAYTGALAQYEPTNDDLDFFRWATSQ